MAISTPTPPDGSASTPATPREEALATVASQVAAIDTLVELAQRSIDVFDVDLSWMGWNGAARAEKLAAFLRSGRGARLRIAVHDTGWIERSCPRLTNMLKHHGHVISIHRTGEDARHAMDPLVIVDNAHFLHRFHVAQPRAALSIGDPQAAQSLIERFGAIWSSAEPGLTATTLGL
jgi:hypothetical protein